MNSIHKFILLFVLVISFFLSWDSKAQCPGPGQPGLAVSSTQTNVSCFGGTDGTITLTIVPGVDPGVAQPPYSIQLYYFSSGLTQLASLTNVSGTTFTFKQGDGSLNSPGADAFGIPANGGGEYYRFDIQSTGGSLICRNRTLFPITITEPTQLTASVNSITPACTPGAGAISLNVSGGSPLVGGPPNYVYNWSGPTAIANTVQNPSGLNGGSYDVTIVDANSCSVTINNIAVALSTVANAGPTQIVCSNSATLAGSAPGPGEVGLWTVVSGSGTITSSGSANSTVTSLGVGNNVFNWFIVDSGHTCAGSNSQVTISWYDIQLAKTADVALLCFGATNGTGTFTASGGTSPYTFSVTSNTTLGTTATTATTLTVSNAGVGSITVKVTDANNCTQSNTINFTQPASALALAKTADVALLCFGATNGTGTFTASGGTSPYTFSVTSNTTLGTTATTATTLTVSNAGVGSITVKVTDANNCTQSNTINFTQPASALALAKTADVALLCFGATNGTGTFTASGGTSPYTFSVTSNTTLGTTATTATTLTVSNAGVGSITVKVTDANNCTQSNTINFIQPASALALAKTADVALLCFGATNGTGTFTASGGTSPYTFSVTSNTTLGTTATTATTLTVSNAGVGSITVKVTDANNCTQSNTINFTQPASALALAKTADVALLCFGATNGTGTFTASGGTSPYTFSVTSNTTLGTTATTATTLTVSNAGVGSITVKVTDANNCTQSNTINFTQPASALALAKTADVALLCFGATNGTGTFTASGGTSPYTFSVTSNTTLGTTATTATTLTVSNAGVGSITVKVTDANNCTQSNTINFTQPASALALAKTADVALLCFGATNGTGTFTASGGTSPYTFSVTSNTTLGTTATTATTLTVSNAGVGSITVKVTDANNCTQSNTINFTQPASALALAKTADVALLCFGATNGTGTFTASGGTSPYTFSVTSNTTLGTTATTATTLTVSNAGVGSITVKVTDANNCTQSNTINFTQPASALALAKTADVALLCFGATNGTGTFTASGGTSPYTFSVTSNTTLGTTATTATTLTVSNAGVGSITVKVTDANNCTQSNTINFIQPASALALAKTADVALLCFGATNGTGTFTASGGTSPYTFSVTSNTTLGTTATTATTLTVSNAGVGSITVKVTDANNCTQSNTINFTQPASALALAKTADVALLCFGATNGTGTFTASGGTSPYTFSVTSNTTLGTTATTATTLTVSNAGVGSITVKVTDANNCTQSNTINFIQPASALALAKTADVALLCFGATNGTGTFTASGGTSPYTFSVTSNTTLGTTATTATTLTVSNAGVGSITVKVTDANNCTQSNTINFTQPASALTAPTSKMDVSCNGGNNGTATVTPTGGTGPYTVLWSTGATTTMISVLTAGTYTVVVTDANSCTANGSATISEPAVLTAPTSKADVSCNGGNNGTATVTPTGGTGPYTVLWSTGATTTMISALIAGTYTVVVTDANSCTANGSATVGQPADLVAPTGGDVTICFDGAVHTGSATPGAGESIVWYTAATGGSVTTAPTGTTSGTYAAFAAAQNATGCESSTRTQVTVKINALPTVTFTTGATTICSGSSSTYTTQAGQSNYVWSVTGGTITAGGTTSDNTAAIQWASAGSVNVNYQDANTCSATSPTSQAVTVDTPPTVAAAGSDQTNMCGTVSLSANSTTPPETGSWSFAPSGNVDGNGSIVTPSSPTSGFNGTPGKTYTLRWTISNGTCPSSSDDVSISFDPTGVTPSAAGPDQNQCNNGSFTLAGNIPTSGTGTWSIVGSANGAAITSSSSNNSTVTGLTLGTSVTLSWSISNGASCTSTDDVVLSNNDNPTSAVAGTDQAVCGTSTTLAGNTPTIGTGAWSITNGTGGSITSTTDPASVFTGIQGNSYTLRWTISNGACSPSFDDVDITFDKTPTTAVAGPDILNACGTISLSANNPTVGVGQWTISSNPDNLGNVATPSSNVSNFNGSAGITYVLTWTITNGSCPNSSDDVSIQYSSTGPTAADAGSDQNICGITTTLSGNTPVVGTGQWSFDTGGNLDGLGVIADVNNQSSGFSGTVGQTYKLVWTITNGTCNSIDQVSIQFNAPPSNSDAGSDQGICGTSTTLAANAPSNGTGAWSITSIADGLGVIANVNNPLSGFSGTAGQTYVLTWTISSGTCTPSTNDVQIAFKDIALTVFNTNYCQNAGVLDLTTIVSATPSGGTLTFTGTQVSGSNFDPTGLSGVQSISVKYDQSGCSLTKSLLINVLLPSNPACSGSGGGGGCSVPVISKQDICTGSDGSITITSVSGGTGPYQFSKDNGLNWSTATSTFPFSFNSLAAGNYSVLVQDKFLCTSTVNTIVIAYNISGSVSKVNDVTTCISIDGKINIGNIQGGSGSYLYSTDGGSTFPYSSLPISGLAAGTYSVVIKDNVPGGCISATTSIVISLPASCTGGGINCGAFTITATDTRPTCSGQDDGTITINVSGGSPNYTATLSDPSQSFNQAMTGPGPFTFGVGPSGGLSPSLTYQYTVLDGVGNTCTLPYSLPIQTNVQATAGGFVDAQCFNQPVGQATVTVASGGTSPYEYSLDAGTTWISFTSPVTITNLMPAAAPYSILVRDDAADLCPAQVSVTINNAVTDITTSFTNTDASCSNNDGTIQVGAVSGGTGPYTYRLDSVDYASLPTNNTFSGLAGGQHKFTVIDAIGCTKYFKTTINFPGLVKFTTPVPYFPSCDGNGTNGSITFNITSPGTFDVGYTTDPVSDPTTFQTVTSDGNTSVRFDNLGGLPHGVYYYVVAKPIGALCRSQSDTIPMIGPIAVDFSVIPKDFVCLDPNGPNGIVRIASIKGSSLVDYTYKIFLVGNPNPDPIQSGTITQLQALPPDTIDYVGLNKGNYQMILSQDQSACQSQPISSTYKSFSINGPTLSSFDTVSVTRKMADRFQASGSMIIVLENTFAPQYLLNLKLIAADFPNQNNKHNLFDSAWVQLDNSTSTVQFEADALYAGTYKLSMIDGTGCERIDTLKISVKTDIFIPNVFTPNNDGKNDNFEIVNLPDNSSIVITNRWGKQVFSGSNFTKSVDGYTTVVWNGGSEVDGVYYYNLNAGGKVYSGWVEILHPSY